MERKRRRKEKKREKKRKKKKERKKKKKEKKEKPIINQCEENTHIHTKREREKKSIKFKVGREGLMIHLNKKYLKKKRKKRRKRKKKPFCIIVFFVFKKVEKEKTHKNTILSYSMKVN